MPLSYDLTTSYILRQKFVKFFVVFFLENLRYQKNILKPLRDPKYKQRSYSLDRATAINLRSKNNKEERKSITYSAEIADFQIPKTNHHKLQLYVDADYTHFVISDGQNKTFRETIV